MRTPFLLTLLFACAARADSAIPYTKFVLDNGLTLLVHEDRKAPIVAVNIWYHVGAKDERPGRTGLAHLFEHLMFTGSEHFNHDHFNAAEKVGATELNGTTNRDRTNYFQNAPKDALDYLLWLESDRMGFCLGALDQKRLDEQRGVVQNEKRQGDNQPYSIAHRLITENIWPQGHPYSWPVIGSMDDLDATTLDDAHAWFKAFYGAANATLVIAGDVAPQAAYDKVRLAFGNIPPGPPVARQKQWIAKREGTRRQRAEDRVPQARLYQVWNVPPYGTREGTWLELVASLLADGQNARLHERLVRDDRTATAVWAYASLGEIAGSFTVGATAAPGASLAAVEAALNEELARLLRDGPAPHELTRIKAKADANFIRSLERIGGFGGKSDTLAMNSVFLDNPDYYQTRQQDIQDATCDQLKTAARDWLSDGKYVLEIHPAPNHTVTGQDVDRTALPVPEIQPRAAFPAIQRARLENGPRLILAQRPGVPLVKITLLADAGFMRDPKGKSGTAKLTASLLHDGTTLHDAQAFDDALALLGASVSANCTMEAFTLSLSALKKNLDPSLALYAELIRGPAFAEADFQRRKTQSLANVRHELREPSTLALRTFPTLLYGAGHPYAKPLSGSGTESDLASLTRDDCAHFYNSWVQPVNATLVIVGDVTLDEIQPKLEAALGGWENTAAMPILPIPTATPAAAPTVIIIDRPGSIQSAIVAGGLTPPRATLDTLACSLLNQSLGGTFTSRINMNLREDKNWTYGARSTIHALRGQQPFYVSAQVQTDKTAPALAELARELHDICGPRPLTDAEFETARQNQSLKLLGQWETLDNIAASLCDLITFGRPDDYYQTLPERYAKLTRADVAATAPQIVSPGRLTWVIVGDRAAIEPAIRALNLGTVTIAPPL